MPVKVAIVVVFSDFVNEYVAFDELVVIVGASLISVIVIVTVCVSVSVPSDKVITAMYVLLAPLSMAASKSGAVLKVREPVEELIDKVDESIPAIDHVKVVPESTSAPVKVTTESWPSGLLIPNVADDEFVVITGASFILVIVIVMV